MVSLKPYLSVNNALEAIDFYKKIFDAKLLTRMGVEKEQSAEFGIPEGADLSKMTMHSLLSIGEAIILRSDNFTGVF